MENIKKFSDVLNEGNKYPIKKYPELTKIAKGIAKNVIKEINEKTKDVESEMPYKSQYTLEELIKILEKLV